MVGLHALLHQYNSLFLLWQPVLWHSGGMRSFFLIKCQMDKEKVIKNLSVFIRKEREKQNISQEKLAWKADIPKSTLQDLEYCKHKNPRLFTVLKLAKGLGIKPHILIQAIQE